MKYDVDYFINKFEAIPEEKWCTGTYYNSDGQFCAFGHCGEYNTGDYAESEETRSLDKLTTMNFNSIATINDGKNLKYQQLTPKQRVLAALKDVKHNCFLF